MNSSLSTLCLLLVMYLAYIGYFQRKEIYHFARRSVDAWSHLTVSIIFFPCLFTLQVEWLLKDEVASSLRHRIPIKRDALQYVTEHIKNSAYKGKPTCSFESIPLHFVYGSECSLNKFREVRLQNYLGIFNEWCLLYFNSCKMKCAELYIEGAWVKKPNSNFKKK